MRSIRAEAGKVCSPDSRCVLQKGRATGPPVARMPHFNPIEIAQRKLGIQDIGDISRPARRQATGSVVPVKISFKMCAISTHYTHSISFLIFPAPCTYRKRKLLAHTCGAFPAAIAYHIHIFPRLPFRGWKPNPTQPATSAVMSAFYAFLAFCGCGCCCCICICHNTRPTFPAFPPPVCLNSSPETLVAQLSEVYVSHYPAIFQLHREKESTEFYINRKCHFK